MATTFDQIFIEFLSGKENYPSWCIKIQDILEENDLWDHVTGNAIAPTIPLKRAAETDSDYTARIAPSVDALNKHNKQAGRALCTIRLCIASSFICQVKSATTAKEIWKKIEDHFKPQGAMGPVILRRNLQAL